VIDQRWHCVRNGAAGFSLIEALIASGILVGAVVGLAQLSTLATTTNLSSRNSTYSTMLASQKLEELRALTWAFDSSGSPVSDVTSNTAVSPESPGGGTGLSLSPATSLQDNTPGYVDCLDASGNKIGSGPQAPTGKAFTRRWSIGQLPSNPDTVVIQVLVTANGVSGAGTRSPDDVLVVGARTRKAE